MAIGTTVKVGFDGEEVKRGFAGLKNGFSAIGRTMGKGAALVGGMMAAQTLEGIIIKAATGTNELADFAGAAMLKSITPRKTSCSLLPVIVSLIAGGSITL